MIILSCLRFYIHIKLTICEHQNQLFHYLDLLKFKTALQIKTLNTSYYFNRIIYILFDRILKLIIMISFFIFRYNFNGNTVICCSYRRLNCYTSLFHHSRCFERDNYRCRKTLIDGA